MPGTVVRRGRKKTAPLKKPGTRAQRKVKVGDKRTKKSAFVDIHDFGPFLRAVREDTPSETREGKPVSMAELAGNINATLHTGEQPISVNIISRLERGRNVFGGYGMRIFQCARALDLVIEVRTKNGSRSITFE